MDHTNDNVNEPVAEAAHEDAAQSKQGEERAGGLLGSLGEVAENAMSQAEEMLGRAKYAAVNVAESLVKKDLDGDGDIGG